MGAYPVQALGTRLHVIDGIVYSGYMKYTPSILHVKTVCRCRAMLDGEPAESVNAREVVPEAKCVIFNCLTVLK